MKNKLKLTCFVLLISLVILSGCKKYPEGPLISFRSKTERVSNTWKFSNCKINGVDATSDYTGTELDLIKNGTADWKFGNEIDNGNWYFDGTKTKITITVSGNYDSTDALGNPTVYTETEVLSCTILQLKEKQMHLSGSITFSTTDPTATDETDTCDYLLVSKF